MIILLIRDVRLNHIKILMKTTNFETDVQTLPLLRDQTSGRSIKNYYTK